MPEVLKINVGIFGELKTNFKESIIKMNTKTINEVKIKIADRFPVNPADKFGFDQDIEVLLKGEIISKQVRNNQDGTVDIILTFKALEYKFLQAGQGGGDE